jgi:hypothetical protein
MLGRLSAWERKDRILAEMVWTRLTGLHLGRCPKPARIGISTSFQSNTSSEFLSSDSIIHRDGLFLSQTISITLYHSSAASHKIIYALKEFLSISQVTADSLTNCYLSDSSPRFSSGQISCQKPCESVNCFTISSKSRISYPRNPAGYPTC